MNAATQGRYRLTFVVLIAGCATYGLLQSLILPVLPTIQEHVHTSQNSVTWVLTAYLLAAAVFLPIMGRTGDMIGKRKMLLVALAGLAVGSLLAAVATSMVVMTVARVIQGLGGGLLPLSFGIIRDEFPREKVTGAIGLLSALIGLGGGAGLALSGPIVDHLGYKWLFLIPMIVAVVAALAALFVVPESRVRTPGRVRALAPVLLSCWLVALLLGVSKAPEWGWVSVRVLGLFVVAAVLAGLWVRVELDSETPLIDMHMMRIPTVWTCNLVAFLLGLGVFAGVGFIPQFLQASPDDGFGFGVGLTESGLIILPQAMFLMVAGSFAAPLARRYGAKQVLVAASVITIVAWILLVVAHAHLWQIALATAVAGTGFGLAFAVVPGLVVAAVPQEQTSVATGMNANIRTIGAAVGAAVVSTIITSSAGADGVPTESGYSWGFAVLAVTAAAGAIACLLVPTLGSRPVRDASLEDAELALTPAATLEEQRPAAL
jgi:EmrB/QacA subfamily drug resistance transporter